MQPAASESVRLFEDHFGGGPPPRCVRAPGRTNLIGEHVDYQDGLVLPMAVDRAVRVWYRPRGDRLLRVHATTFDETRQIDLGRPLERTGTWLDYAAGVAWALAAEGVNVPGLDALVTSDLPIGVGLSSSAALEVAFALALLDVAEVETDRAVSAHDNLAVPYSRAGSLTRQHRRHRYAGPCEGLALLCRRAENEFVGVGCGIMDQFACLFGRADHALLLDCRSLAYEQVPLPPDLVRVVLADTGVPRSLAASAYNERLRECAEAVERLRRWAPDITALRDVSPDLLEAHGGDLPATLARRCRHVVSEIGRVRCAAEVLRQGDMAEMGRLLFASHESLRDDYAVSSPELDAMVAAAMAQPGVYGARLTGAGFGGCTVNLVAPEAVDAVCEGLARDYHARTGRDAVLYVTRPADGAGIDTADARRGLTAEG